MEHKLQKTLDRLVDNKKVHGTSFSIKFQDVTWSGASGNFQVGEPFFIASTTKLFVTAIILKFRSQGRLSTEDKISAYLSGDILKDLHVFRGKEYSNELSVSNLLSHTSGLPDYFQGKKSDGTSLEKELTAGHDRHWTFEEAIGMSKSLKPHFIPGEKGKAHYSDTNFQLLGRIIERISGKGFSEVIDELILKPLSLNNTFLYADSTDTRPKTLFYKDHELRIPRAMTSFGPDGGIVSTSTDLLKFIESFFTGALFPESYIPELKIWNPIFFPMQSGIGIHRFKLPWIFDPMGKLPEMIGHSGLSGALAYACPEERIFIAGTVNQVAYPDISFRTMLKLVDKAKGTT